MSVESLPNLHLVPEQEACPKTPKQRMASEAVNPDLKGTSRIAAPSSWTATCLVQTLFEGHNLYGATSHVLASPGKLTKQAERVILRSRSAIVSTALLVSLFRLNFETGGFETHG